MLKALDTVTKIIQRSLDVVRTLEAYGGHRKRRKLAQVIHLTYLRLNECISTGEQIIDVLESFAKDPTQYSYSGKHHIQGDGIYLDALIDRQSENLDALADCLQDYSEIFRALDSSLYLDLHQFIAFKGVGVDWIAILLKRREIPFDSLGAEDLERLAARSRFMLEECSTNESEDSFVESLSGFLPWYGQVGEISRRMAANSISLTNLFDDDQSLSSGVNSENIERLKSFLQRNDLKRHLVEAKANLQKMRTFIEENFSVVELTIDVGSKQLKKKVRW